MPAFFLSMLCRWQQPPDTGLPLHPCSRASPSPRSERARSPGGAGLGPGSGRAAQDNADVPAAGHARNRDRIRVGGGLMRLEEEHGPVASEHRVQSPIDRSQGASERARALAWLAAEPSAAAPRSRGCRSGGRFTWEVDAEERPSSAGARARSPAPERRHRPPASAPAHRRADREPLPDREPAHVAHREQGLREGPNSGLVPTARSAERYEAPDLASDAARNTARERSLHRRMSAGHEHHPRNFEPHEPYPESGAWIGYGADRALARGSGGAADPDHIRQLRQRRDEMYQSAEPGYVEDNCRSSSGSSAAGEPFQAPYSPSPRASPRVDPRASHDGGALAALLAEMHGSRGRAGSAHARANPNPASTATPPDLGPWDSAWDRTRAAAEAAKPARGTAASAAAAGGRSKPSEFAHLFGEDGRRSDGPVAQRLEAELREAGARQGRGGRAVGGYGGTLEGYQGGRHGSGMGRELLRDISPLRAFRGGSGAREGRGPAPHPAARPCEEGARGAGQEGRRAHNGRQAPWKWERRAPDVSTEDAWRGVSPLSGLRLGSQARAQYS